MPAVSLRNRRWHQKYRTTRSYPSANWYAFENHYSWHMVKRSHNDHDLSLACHSGTIWSAHDGYWDFDDSVMLVWKILGNIQQCPPD